MRVSQYIPHRYFANKGLQHTADEIRREIDTQKTIFEDAIKKCNLELEQAAQQRQSLYEEHRKDILSRLQRERSNQISRMRVIQDYTQVYLERKSWLDLKAKRTALKRAYSSEAKYLRTEKKLIQRDIDLLRDRKAILSSQVNVDDIVATIALSNPDFIISPEEDAKSLLLRVRNSIQSEADRSTRRSLIRLSQILGEKAEYLPEINYIDWMIGQKGILWEDLERQVKSINKKESQVIKDSETEQAAIDELDDQTRLKWEKVSSLWETPLQEIYAQKDQVQAERAKIKEQQRRKKREKNDTQAEIDRLYSKKPLDSWDQDKLKRLRKEKAQLKNELDDLSEEWDRQDERFARLNHQESDAWALQTKVISLLKNYGVFPYRKPRVRNHEI